MSSVFRTGSRSVRDLCGAVSDRTASVVVRDWLGDVEQRGAGPEVEIRRSARRRRTVSARREGDKVVVLMPTGLSKKAEADLVAR